MNNYDVVAEIRADLKNYTSNVNEAIDEMKQLEQQTSGSTSKISSFTKGLGTAMIGAGAAVTAMGVKSLTGFGNFQASLNKAAVVAGGTSKDIGGLADVANRMGAELPLSAQDAADAMVQMAQDGASLDTIKEEFPSIAKAATAAGADLQSTAGTVQVAMNIWGDSIGSSAQAAAVLTETANVSNASIEDMQQAFADVGSMAASLGINMQDTATAIGMVTNSGVPAAQAAQDLNFALTKMVKPSKAAAGVAKELGISYYDANGKMKSLPDILKQVSSATSGLSEKQRQNYLVTMYGTAGYKAINPLLKAVSNTSGKTSQSWDAMSKAINGASSSTAAANKVLNSQAKDMQQNIGSKIEQVGGNWESLSNKAAAASGGVTGALLDMTNGALSWAQTSNNGIAKFTRGFIGLAPVIGPATTAVGAFIRSAVPIANTIGAGAKGIINFVKTAATIGQIASGVSGAGEALSALAKSSKIAAVAQWALNSAFLANPITWIVAGIAAVVAALAIFFTKTKTGQQLWQSFMTWLSGAWTGLQTVAANVWNAITTTINSVATSVQVVWNEIPAFFSNLWTGITSAASAAWSGFTATLSAIWSTITTTASTVFTALGAFFGTIWNGIVSVATAVWNTFGTSITAIWNGIVTIAKGVWNMLKSVIMGPILIVIDLLTGDLTKLGSDLSLIWNSIKNAAVQIWNGLKTYFSGVLSFWKALFSSVWKAISSALSAIWGAIVSTGKSLWNGFKSFMSGLWNAVKSATSAAWNGIKSAVSSITSGTISGAKSAWNGFKSFMSALWSGIKSTASAAWNGLKSTVISIAHAIYNGAKAAWSGFTGMVRGVVNGVRGAFSALRNINLLAAGKAIINSFFNGLVSAYSKVKSFISGIGDWIRKHKGPISYDRKLLIPAGNAIMNGLNAGLKDQFGYVQKNVSGMADAIAAAATPSISMGDIAGTINSANRQLNEGMTASVQGQLSVNQRPLNVSMNVNGTEWRGFVADITNTQDVQLQLQS